jgi:hypothetical protein
MSTLLGFDEQATEAVVRACEKASRSMRDWQQPDALDQIVAKRIVELASKGERDPDELCEQALRAFGFYESPRLQPGASEI